MKYAGGNLAGKVSLRPIVCVFFILITHTLFAQRMISLATEEWAPFRINDSEEPSGFIGIDIDLIRQLEKRLGLIIKVESHPRARAIEMLKNGQIDCISGYAYTEEREVFALYVPTPYFAVQPVFYALKGHGSSITTYEDLYGKKIGQSKNSTFFNKYNIDMQLTKVDISSELQIIQMLELGRIDLMIGTDPNISWIIAKLGLSEKFEKTVFEPMEKTDLFIAFSRKSPAVDLVPLIDKAIADMIADKTIETIVSTYR